MKQPTPPARLCWLLSLGWTISAGLALVPGAFAQPAPTPGVLLPLNDLSAFVNPTPNWRIAGSAQADMAKANTLTTDKGTGVLVNIPMPVKAGQSPYGQPFNAVTTLQHGDVDLELDYMMAPKANSGVYLQGRYEVQLFDSWEVRTPRTDDNGSIYDRWDEKRPAGQQGYDGHPARQNASRAPGLWQHLKISFQAPRFTSGAGGLPQKTENARMIRVELNGVVIHEDVELTGPTRSAAFSDEKALGPLMLQGDHGAVAFRNIRYTSYDKPRPQLMNLNYSVYKGKYEKEPDYGQSQPESKGTASIMSSEVSRMPNEFLIRYTGTLRVAEPGEYRFNLGAPGGGGMLKINNQPVVALGDNLGKVTLPKGDLPFELLYSKFVDWIKPNLGLTVAGPGIRQYTLTDPTSGTNDEVDPIIVAASTNTILRSFMDMPDVSVPTSADRPGETKTVRVVHAVSVGTPEQIHYTYDLDKGALVQVWRGGFLDATPMWHERGDGSSRPMGMVQSMGAPVLFLSKLASPQTSWTTDTTGSGYRPKGYVLDEVDRPTFRYLSYGTSVDDKIRVLPNGQGIQREVVVAYPTGNLYARLASGTRISALENGMYLVDGQEYLRIDDAAGARPVIRAGSNGRQELIVPVKAKVVYSILF